VCGGLNERGVLIQRGMLIQGLMMFGMGRHRGARQHPASGAVIQGTRRGGEWGHRPD
jgi:hypothetical protein